MTKRIARLALAAGAAAAFAVPSAATAVPNCTDRPIEDCLSDLLKADFQVPCIPNGDLESPC